MFESMANSMYLGLMLVSIFIFGVKTSLSPRGLDMWEFMALMGKLLIVLTILRFYSQPNFLFGGRGFVYMIVDSATALANQIEAGQVTRVTTRLNMLWNGIEAPGTSVLAVPVEVGRWLLTIILIALAQVAVYLIIGFGYLATAVLVLVGPLFIPWLIIPESRFLFDGWFRALLQYAFYPVTAQAMLFVLGNLLVNFIDRAGVQLSGPQLGAIFLPLTIMLAVFTLGLFKAPSLNNSIFAGKSGESIWPSSW